MLLLIGLPAVARDAEERDGVAGLEAVKVGRLFAAGILLDEKVETAEVVYIECCVSKLNVRRGLSACYGGCLPVSLMGV